MKHEDKDLSLRKGAELNEDELDGVTGGIATHWNTFQGIEVNRLNAAVNGGSTLATNAINPTNRENLGKM